MFTVEIPTNKNKSILKDLIKEKLLYLDRVAASKLVIWQVNVPFLNFQKSEVYLVDNNPLLPIQTLSKVFPAPDDSNIHDIFKCPSESVGKADKFHYGTYGGKTLKLTVTW